MVDGATTASPLSTARIAASSSLGGTSLSMKPLAPAFSAEKAYSSRSKVVRMSTFGASSFCPPAQIRRVASTPSRCGMRTSMRITSTWTPRSTSKASTPLPASATTSMSGCAASTIRKPVRSSTWSSTSITRMVMCKGPFGQEWG